MISKISIGKKILLIPLIGIVSFSIYLLISTITASKNVTYLNDAKEVQFPFVLLVVDVANKVDGIEASLNQAATTADTELVQKAESLSSDVLNSLNNLRKISPDAEEELAEIETTLKEYIASGKFLTQSIITNTIEINKLGSMGKDLNETLSSLKGNILQLKENRIDQLRSSIDSASKAGENLVSIGLLVGLTTIALLLLISIPISRNVQGSLEEVVYSLRQMAEGEGNLTVRLQTKNQDEVGQLVKWFNAFVEKLQFTIRDILAVSSPLAEMAEKVNTSARESKTITESQQTDIEQTRVAVSEMYSSVANIAKNASLTADSVDTASQLSKNGTAVVGDTIESISKLSDSVLVASDVVNRLEQDVDKVSNVLSVIRSIAEQTNLLALNAAIEAARAGEQGRGFAVVADEVRTLASRTQSSTTEIQATIEKLQSAAREAVDAMLVGKEAADVSVGQAAKAGDALQEIEATVSQINSMAITIATATEEQSTVAANIASSVEGMSASTETTRRSATELADVSSELKELAATLNRLTSGFSV